MSSEKGPFIDLTRNTIMGFMPEAFRVGIHNYYRDMLEAEVESISPLMDMSWSGLELVPNPDPKPQSKRWAETVSKAIGAEVPFAVITYDTREPNVEESIVKACLCKVDLENGLSIPASDVCIGAFSPEKQAIDFWYVGEEAQRDFLGRLLEAEQLVGWEPTYQ